MQSRLPAKRTLNQLGIPRRTFYRWYDRFLEGGPEALEDRPSAPSRVWNRIGDDVQDQIIEMALEYSELSPRELAVRFTDEKRYFVSEATVYRLLKAHDLITSPAYVLIKAADQFHTKTTRPNEMWQTDFTCFKIEARKMSHVRGAPCHPQTQGKTLCYVHATIPPAHRFVCSPNPGPGDNSMRKFILAATLASFAVPLAPALADPPRWSHNEEAHDRNADRRDDRDYRKHHRRYDQRDDRRNYGRYDYNRPDPRYGNYRADRYYAAGDQYRPRRLAANDRIYRGQDNRYYCRRDDGTTGLIIGGLAGGLLGNTIAPGGSKTLGTILGGGAGALLGRSIDRNGSNVSCR